MYDFLYRDAGRMASYYAQIFSGRLSSLEQTDSERTSEDKGAKLNIQVASGDLKQTHETARTAKRRLTRTMSSRRKFWPFFRKTITSSRVSWMRRTAI